MSGRWSFVSGKSDLFKWGEGEQQKKLDKLTIYS